MNKFHTTAIFSLLVAAGAFAAGTSVKAMPIVAVDQSLGLLGSPIAQLPIQDPVVEQAIDHLRSKQVSPVNERKLPIKPETISRSRHNLDGVLILGGAEALPM